MKCEENATCGEGEGQTTPKKINETETQNGGKLTNEQFPGASFIELKATRTHVALWTVEPRSVWRVHDGVADGSPIGGTTYDLGKL